MKLGEPVSDDNENLGLKDAVHVAVVAVRPYTVNADDDEEALLKPGQPVRFTGDAMSQVRACKTGEDPHGIVDPFVTHCSDGNFYLVLVDPKLLRGTMTHNWELNQEADGGFTKNQWDCRGCS